MGAKPKIDWQAAFDEFLLVHKPNGMLQKDFATLKGVQPTYLSLRFNEIESERIMESNKAEMPKLMQTALKGLKEALNEEPDRQTVDLRTGIGVEAKAKLTLATATAMADRLGMSPQAMTLNVQQNNLNKAAIQSVPFFQVKDTEMESLLQGNVKAIDAE